MHTHRLNTRYENLTTGTVHEKGTLVRLYESPDYGLTAESEAAFGEPCAAVTVHAEDDKPFFVVPASTLTAISSLALVPRVSQDAASADVGGCCAPSGCGCSD